MLADELKAEISKRIINGKLPTMKICRFKGLTLFAEEWESACLECAEVKLSTDEERFNYIRVKAQEMVDADWEGYFYIEPTKCKVAHGITVYYGRKKHP